MSMWRGWTGATQSSLVDPRAGYGLTQAVYDGLMGHRVKDNHVFTARMCAASRCLESSRRDRLFADPVSELLAGWEGMEAPMGSWILIPRTSYGDGVLQRAYHTDARTAARQLVLLGAGMDSRAYRPELNVPELRVFEVDHGENFRVKEAILQHPAVQAAFPLAVASRQVVSTDFAEAGQAEDCQPRWARDLCAAGFDPGVPSSDGGPVACGCAPTIASHWSAGPARSRQSAAPPPPSLAKGAGLSGPCDRDGGGPARIRQSAGAPPPPMANTSAV
ncbi:unnamed protein product [Prorocentrum cordatum]|uniref:[Phosphatase 2A protein]-leucine-carboxy methyltransferase 1 n=1 Tax=Prorocentrum cordatum TaxID=2364126 RepID=A0ABN9UB99_9DINO|nr:unnamed protein product [Polarella glacialis]